MTLTSTADTNHAQARNDAADVVATYGNTPLSEVVVILTGKQTNVAHSPLPTAVFPPSEESGNLMDRYLASSGVSQALRVSPTRLHAPTSELYSLSQITRPGTNASATHRSNILIQT